jgi:hypothetical protein
MTLSFWSCTPRSKIKAKAKIEQRISGQMGQPAACMMDNKKIPSSLGLGRALIIGECLGLRVTPISVDNFVKNFDFQRVQHTQVFINSSKLERVFLKNTIKSMTCVVFFLSRVLTSRHPASDLACGVLPRNRAGLET